MKLEEFQKLPIGAVLLDVREQVVYVEVKIKKDQVLVVTESDTICLIIGGIIGMYEDCDLETYQLAPPSIARLFE